MRGRRSFIFLKFDDNPIGSGRKREKERKNEERQVDDNLQLEGENPDTRGKTLNLKGLASGLFY